MIPPSLHGLAGRKCVDPFSWTNACNVNCDRGAKVLLCFVTEKGVVELETIDHPRGWVNSFEQISEDWATRAHF